MKNTKLPFIVVLLTITLGLVSCEKADEKPDTSAAFEGAIATNLFDDVFKQADNAAKLFVNEPALSKGHILGFAEGCGTITIDPIDDTFPKTIIIDFGDVNCTGIDLRARRGIIEAVISDWYRNEGCILTITTTDYHVDDYGIAGTKTIINNGLNASENLTFSVTVINGIISPPEGGAITWNTSRTNEWISGADTKLNILDDVYEITGTASGITSREKAYAMTIIKPLNVALECPWIRSGTIEIISDPATITLDYGDGHCDANATATILGKTYPIVIR